MAICSVSMGSGCGVYGHRGGRAVQSKLPETSLQVELYIRCTNCSNWCMYAG